MTTVKNVPPWCLRFNSAAVPFLRIIVDQFLEHGRMTDTQLHDRMVAARLGLRVTQSGLRTRRKILERAGIVRNSGAVVRESHGTRASILWEVVPEELEKEHVEVEHVQSTEVTEAIRYLATVVDEQRKAMGISWNEIARTIGVHPMTLMHMRTKGRGTNFETLMQIISWLDLDDEELGSVIRNMAGRTS